MHKKYHQMRLLSEGKKMDENTHVYCTECAHFDLKFICEPESPTNGDLWLDTNTTPNALKQHSSDTEEWISVQCKFGSECHFWDWEDSTPFSIRPKYESKMQ